MIKVLLDQYYTGLASLLSKSICASSKMPGKLLLGQKRREMSNKGIARGGEQGGGGYAFPFTALILCLRLRGKTLYINRNGFRLA